MAENTTGIIVRRIELVEPIQDLFNVRIEWVELGQRPNRAFKNDTFRLGSHPSSVRALEQLRRAALTGRELLPTDFWYYVKMLQE